MFKKKQNDEIQLEPQDVSSNEVHIEEEKEEKEHKGVKIITGILAIAFIAFALYSIVDRVIYSVDKRNSLNSYLTLDGMNVNETKEVLSSFGKEKQGQIKDHALIGTKLFLSENKITEKTYKDGVFFDDTEYNNFAFYDVLNNTSKDETTDISNGKKYLNLNYVEEGNYLIFPFASESTLPSLKDYNFYSFHQDEAVDYTFYTWPSENGERKRVEILNNSISPYTICKVKDAGNTLPSYYYDVVLLYQEYKDGNKLEITDAQKIKLTAIKEELERETGLKIYSAPSLQDAILTNANYAFVLTDSEIEKPLTSLFNTTSICDVDLYEDGELKGYDAVPEIRELTGAIDNAYMCYSSIPLNDMKPSSSKRVGKEAYLVHDEKANVLEVLNSLR